MVNFTCLQSVKSALDQLAANKRDRRSPRWHRISLVLVGFVITLVLAHPTGVAQPTATPMVVWQPQAEQAKTLYQNQNYLAAEQIWQALVQQLQHDPLNQAMALSNLSLTQQQLGQWQNAAATIQQSQQLLATIGHGRDRDRLLAQTLDIWGRLSLIQGQPQQALSQWQEAEKIYIGLKDEAAIAQNQLNQTQALQQAGDYLLAEKQLTDLRQRLQQHPDRRLTITGLRNLGTVRRQLGQLQEARKDLQEALELARRSQFSALIPDLLLDLGNLEQAVAKQRLDLDKPDEAQQAIQTAQTYFEQGAQQARGQPKLQLRAALNQVSLGLATQQIQLAIPQLKRIPALLSQLDSGRFAVYAHLRYVQYGIDGLDAVAKQSLTGVDWPTVRSLVSHAQQALQQAQILQDQRAQAQALGLLGKLYDHNQQWLQAKQLTQQALNLATTADLMYQLHWQMGRLIANPPAQQKPDLDAAIQHYRKAIDALDQVRYNLMPTNPDVQFAFRDQVEPVYRELVDLLLQQPTQDHLKQTLQFIDQLQIAELEDFLRCRIARKERLPDFNDPVTAMIYPIILPDRIAVILQLPGTNQPLIYHATPVSQEQVNQTLLEFRDTLADISKAPKVDKLAQQVYRWILEPIAKQLETSEVSTLVFAPDGLLRTIPFAALHDGSKYLINSRYAIAIASKLKLFEPTPTPSKLIVFKGGVSKAQTIHIQGQVQEFTEIQYLQPELDGIANTPIVRSGSSLIDQQFTTINLKSELQSQTFSAIHLKTHGKYSVDPDETFILAYQEPIPSAKFRELMRLASKDKTTPLELLILSACHSAQGDNRAVLGLAGIAVDIGAKSTISSLWEAQDEENARLMVQFYQQLSQPGMSKAKALKIAQTTLYQHDSRPFVWASYVLVGNWK